jgi:hypothetical protein
VNEVSSSKRTVILSEVEGPAVAVVFAAAPSALARQQKKIRHFDQSFSRLCEQRRGEIRFSCPQRIICISWRK